jgi:4-hydroxybenzoate polyprenyltransferase
LLSFKEGLFWALAWAFLALIGAYILNPICVLIFVVGCLLEAIYCLLWHVSPFRTFVSGAVKTSGAIAAVFAVDPNPSLKYLGCLFLLLFFWEIGGQNIPNDWADFEEDLRMDAKTIPVRWGLPRANLIIMATIMLTLCMNALIFYFSKTRFELIFIILSFISGCYLLLLPAIRLYKAKERSRALALFNQASYYPLVLLMAVVIRLWIQ